MATARLSSILRHGNHLMKQIKGKQARVKEHDKALHLWADRVATASPSDQKNQLAATANPGGSVPNFSISFAHILFQRTLIKAGGSHRDFHRWAKAASISGAEALEAMSSRRISMQLTETMAEHELAITGRLLFASAMAGVAADAREQVLAVRLQMVLWSWPRGVPKDPLPSGVIPLGRQGPWLASRLAGTPQLGSDHGASAKARLIQLAVSKNCLLTGSSEHASKVMRFYASDGARDAVKAGNLLAEFPNLCFKMVDTSHANILALKRAFSGDDEVEAVDRLLVSGKSPPSLAKFLSTSARFRELFKEECQADCVTGLKHFGWAPQRFTSKSRPYSRLAIRLRQAFSTVAAESEGSDPQRREWAAHLLLQLGGQSSMRLVLAGLLADLAYEHYKWVQKSDLENPDISQVTNDKLLFIQRCEMLFVEGMVFTPEGKSTFTGQVLEFLRSNNCIYFQKQAQVFGIPDTGVQEDSILWEPLHRIRSVLTTLKGFLDVYRPEHSWQNKFQVFSLPSPLGTTKRYREMPATDLQELRGKVKNDFGSIVSALDLDKEAAFAEFLKLLPFAEAHRKAGCSMQESWAQASKDWPELKLGRLAVTAMVGAVHSTGDVERQFREVVVQERKDRAHMLDCTLESLLLANQAPDVEELASRVPQPDGSVKLCAKGSFMPEVAQAYTNRWNNGRDHHKKRKTRRDKGVPRNLEEQRKRREEAGQPKREVDVLRDREKAITGLLQQDVAERKKLAQASVFKGRQAIPEENPAVLAELESERLHKIREQAAKRARQLHEQATQAKPSISQAQAVTARAAPTELVAAASSSSTSKRKQEDRNCPEQGSKPKQARWATKGDRAKHADSVIPSFALVPDDDRLRRACKSAGFQVKTDVLSFLPTCCLPKAQGPPKVPLVVVSNLSQGIEDIPGLVCRLVGGFLCSSKSLLAGAPYGVQFQSLLTSQPRIVAISDKLRQELPQLPAILGAAARAPASQLEFVSQDEVKKRRAAYIKKNGAQSRPWKSMRIALTASEWSSLPSRSRNSLPGIYNGWSEFLVFLSAADREAKPPGYW